jgi:hypothetical protein
MASFGPWRRSRLLSVLGVAGLRLWATVGCGLLNTDVLKKSDVKSRAVWRDQEPKSTTSGLTHTSDMAHAFSRRAEECETIRIAAGIGLFFA